VAGRNGGTFRDLPELETERVILRKMRLDDAGKRLTEIVQLLQYFLRAAELEMKAAEEPLSTDLDVKGLKVQVLARIEVLEEREREREREELLAELLPAMEVWGHDTAALKAVLSG
jgi:hypothetical protein